MENKRYRILSLMITNARTIEVVDITPRDDVVIIEGPNGQGKTTVLQMLESAFKSDTDDKIVRDGEETAQSIVNLGDYSIRRTIKKGKPPTIEVRRVSDGKRAEMSATEFITDITGKVKKRPIALDIASIIDMDPKERLSTLMEIAGIDAGKVAELDERYKTLFETRRDEKKELARLETGMNTLQAHAVPVAEPPSTAALAQRQKEINAELSAIEKICLEKKTADEKVNSENIEIDRLNELLRAAILRRDEAQKQSDDLVKKIVNSNEVPLRKEAETIASEMQEVDAKRSAYTKHVEYQAAKKAWADQNGALNRTEKSLEAVVEEKKAVLAAGKYPIPHLSVADGEIYFKNKHWSQLCESEKLKVALGIAQGLDPKLRVLVVRNGNAFDPESMRKVRAWAKENDFQIWMERVSSVPHLGGSVFLVEGKPLSEEEKKDLIEQKKENPDE